MIVGTCWREAHRAIRITLVDKEHMVSLISQQFGIGNVDPNHFHFVIIPLSGRPHKSDAVV